MRLLTLYSDFSISETKGLIKTSIDKLFTPTPSSSEICVARIKAFIEASLIVFLLTVRIALIIGESTSFESFACIGFSTDPRIDPMTFAAKGFKLLCESSRRGLRALNSSTRDFKLDEDVSRSPAFLSNADKTSSRAAFLIFQEAFPSFEP